MASKGKSALSGAGTGAMTGAAIGSVVPGIGTAIGAVGGGLIGGIGGYLTGDDSNPVMDQIIRNQKLYEGLQTPDLSWQNFNPDEYQYVGDYNPEQAQGTLVSEDPNLKSAQMAALNKMAGLAETGLSDVDNAAFTRAETAGNREARSGELAAIQNAQARGVGGSGLEFAMGEQARQGAAERAQQAELERASEAAKERALYAQAYGSGLSNVRGQDFSANSANSNILNQFNMANTNANNTYGYQNTQNRQNVANQNTGQNNAAQMYNQQGKNQTRQQNFDNQYKKVAGEAGANEAAAKGYAAVDASNNENKNQLLGLGAKMYGSYMGAGGGS